jgi:metal-responsive CopG/Arc/MetJ family transcriptional regulator
MAKVMISMPDDLLEQLDQRADLEGETRSGLLRRLVEREVGERSAARQAEVERLLSQAGPMGGDSVARIRADRARR